MRLGEFFAIQSGTQPSCTDLCSKTTTMCASSGSHAWGSINMDNCGLEYAKSARIVELSASGLDVSKSLCTTGEGVQSAQTNLVDHLVRVRVGMLQVRLRHAVD